MKAFGSRVLMSVSLFGEELGLFESTSIRVASGANSAMI